MTFGTPIPLPDPEARPLTEDEYALVTRWARPVTAADYQAALTREAAALAAEKAQAFAGRVPGVEILTEPGE